MTDKFASPGMEKLKQRYRDGLPAKLQALDTHWKAVELHGWQIEETRKVHDICHSLAGTAETFGLPEVTATAKIITETMKAFFDNATIPDQPQLTELGGNIAALLSFDRDQATELNSADATGQLPESYDSNTVYQLSTLPIYIVEDDQVLADHIAMELALHGYDARAVYSLAELEHQFEETDEPIGAVIMDIIFPEAVTGGIDLINQLHEKQILKAPVIFISASDSFSTRLEVVRAGGEAFFVKPFDMHLLIDTLESLIGETNPDPLRILVLDDDEFAANFACTFLEEAGLRTKAITDPTIVIETVLEFNPDLVILDMHMPVANGMEVAKVLRQHESCSNLPLLFLSAETDPKIRADALNIGVDDFLVKPVDHHYLVSAVANRAQRARALGTKILRDSLTHLLVHDEIKNQLADLLSNAKRHSRSLAYIIIDIDLFKTVNDTYGHLTGDHVIKSLASLLRRSFRRSDILGRYGGEEFVVIMQDTTLDDACKVMDRLREDFAQIRHVSQAEREEFQVTLSAGLAVFPDYGESALLQHAADQALYKAKNSGRNRICVAT